MDKQKKEVQEKKKVCLSGKKDNCCASDEAEVHSDNDGNDHGSEEDWKIHWQLLLAL